MGRENKRLTLELVLSRTALSARDQQIALLQRGLATALETLETIAEGATYVAIDSSGEEIDTADPEETKAIALAAAGLIRSELGIGP